MASFQSGNSSEDGRHHKRTKSSVLKSFMQHKRTPSNGGALSSVQPSDARIASPVLDYSNAMPFLPDDHPYSKPLGELPQNHQAQQFLSPPKTSRESRRPTTSEEGSPTRSLHKKTLSSISLKSLAGREKESKNKESKPKKTKSSTNLATLLSRPKSTKSLKKRATEDEVRNSRDKENCSPVDINARPPPIYAQFSSDAFTVQPLGGKFLEDEIDLYTPKNYSPGKQRDFYQVQGTTPSLTRRDELPQRPKSTYLPSSFSVQDITRNVSNGSRRSADITRRVSGSSSRPSFERKTTEPTTKGEVTIAKRGSRVMAAVAAFGAKTKAAEAAPVERVLEDKDVDKEFEAMLDRRNIPEHQRGKMRNLALPMKKDFVKQDWAEIAAAKNGRPGTNGSDSSADATAGTEEIPEVKSKRPRSKTFTLSRKSSKETVITSKKPRPVSTISKHSRQKSIDSTKSGNSLTSAGAALASNMIAKAKGQCPDDFVSYLRKVQKPELIEVGRLHKLRLLLRNETVAWTDDFIRQGGMEEIVGLLNRTMEVEWREEHEDLLLHEVLLCLKALCTTALALQHLNQIQSTLFPALLGMVFDEEKKGPSEFTTRNIISSLIFTYLKSSPLPERTHRAKMVLSYLRDPEPKEEERPVGFVLEMRHPRPYRVWCKEVVNVTKEVFWIFLHNHNVIARPSSKSSDDANTPSEACLDPQYAYMIKNFPQELPPVPAAPYVGGVEWDATNYLASHIEILNAILVCLPTMEERNSLREELRVSGWEKCMGGTLRLCKEKFYGGVHAGLRCWVAAAIEDGWDTRDVRCGPAAEIRSPVKNTSPRKKVEEVPKLAFDFKFEAEKKTEVDAWL